MDIVGYLLKNYAQVRNFALVLFTVLQDPRSRRHLFGPTRLAVARGVTTSVIRLPVPRPSLSGPQVRMASFLPLFFLVTLVVGGCGGRDEPTPTPTVGPARAMVPTFTPTAMEPPTATPLPPTPAPAASGPEQPSPTPEPAEPTPTETPSAAQATIANELVNVRRGPGTGYGLLGSAAQGQAFEILARNPAGDWWQICCVNGEPGWVFGELVQVSNGENVAIAENIPPPPPPPTPVPATPTPEPQPVTTDPCAGIGGDGCKFKVTGGPTAGDNGGQELKLQLFFIHSGVDGGQPQGSYFIVLEKDGQRLPISDRVRSVALARNEGPLGPYNYEYKLGISELPGNNVAGSYVGWVLDGNGERDSQNFSFQLGQGQGLVWIQFDQN